MAAIVTLAALLLAGGDRIVLRESAEVDGRYVRLLDVIESAALSPDAVETLRDVWLGRVPEGDEGRVITAEEIRRELERRDIRPSRFVFVGESVTVRLAEKGTVRTGLAVRSQLQEELKRRFLDEVQGADKNRFAVRVNYLSVREFPAGAKVVSLSPRERLRIGPIHFKAVVAADGEKGTEVDGIARICRVVSVAFTRRALRRNHVLRMDDVVMKELELDSTEGYCTDLGLLVGGKVLDGVGAGEALSPGLVKFRMIIRRGDTVTVIGELFQAEGSALDDATIGDYVRVKFGKTGKVVQCRVSGPGRAEFIRGEK